MKADFSHLPFQPADILLPRDCDLTKWAVVACDQYTSQPEYWQRVEEYVGRAPSALRLILPESCLEGPSVETDITEVNTAMSRYLREGRFDTLPNSLIYVERTLSSGKIRRGLMGKLDLEQYDYEPGAETLARATEGTVFSRIPPRVAVRKHAPIELPHVMLLTDDPQRTVIEPLSEEKGRMTPLYDFELMEGGGHLAGWRLNGAQMEGVAAALAALAVPERFQRQYGMTGTTPMLFAVGDGNHSLAAAKECCERQKRLTSPELWQTLPARYALVELCNLHDPAIEFMPIHRLVFGVKPEQLLEELKAAYPGAYDGTGEGHILRYVTRAGEGNITVPNPASSLPVGTLESFLEPFIAHNRGVSIDYIHGEDVVRRLASRPDAVGFLLSPMGKEELFPTVVRDGSLPRKTFSIGQAQDKRFYLEARKIR